MTVTYEGIWTPYKFGGWRILVNGHTFMVCEEFEELEREYARVKRAFKKKGK